MIRSRTAPSKGSGNLARLALLLCAAAAALAVFAGTASADEPTAAGSFGCEGACGGFGKPGRLAVDEASGDVYVIDETKDAVDRFSASGAFISQLTVPVEGGGSFEFDPDAAVAVDNSGGPNAGSVYVANGAAGGAVFAFGPDGSFKWRAEGFSEPEPCGIGVNGTGEVFAVNFGSGLQQIDPETGALEGAPFLGGHQVCTFAFDAADNLYLSVYAGSPIVFDAPDYSTSTPWHTLGSDDIAVDRATSEVYVDGFNPLQVYDPANIKLAEVTAGPGAYGVAVNSATGKIYLSNATENKIEIFNRIGSTAKPTHALTIDLAGSGSVQCSLEGGPFESCAPEYEEGAEVAVKATAAAHSHFVSWTGCDSLAGPEEEECQLTMGASDRTVEATFAATMRKLALLKAGTGSGTVTCNAVACASEYQEGAIVTISASAASGSTFAGFSGACSGTGACQLTMNGDATVTATFNASGGGGGGGNTGGGGGNTGGGGGNTGGGGGTGGGEDKSAAYAQCIGKANQTFAKAQKQAKKKHGKARAKAMKKANKAKQRAKAACKSLLA